MRNSKKTISINLLTWLNFHPEAVVLERAIPFIAKKFKVSENTIALLAFQYKKGISFSEN